MIPYNSKHSKDIREFSRDSNISLNQTFAYWSFKFLSTILRNLFRLILDFRVTILWVIAYVYLSKLSMALGISVLVAAALFFVGGFVGKIVGGKWAKLKHLHVVTPLISDATRSGRQRMARAEIEEAYRFFEHANIMKVDELVEMRVPARMFMDGEDWVIEVDRAVAGKTSEEIVKQVKAFKSVVNAVRVSSKSLPNGGIRLTLFVNDPLDAVHKINKPMKLSPDKMKVECAVNSFGETVTMQMGGKSGVLVGGEPGSGKTAGVLTFLIPLALSDYVNLSIIDGKGADDWSNYAPLCSDFVAGDEDLSEPLRVLEAQYNKMLARKDIMKGKIGNSNFWNVSAEDRLKAGLKAEVLVIDECQGLFEESGRSKDEKEMMSKIVRYSSALVKRGRSLGMITIFMSQKLDAKSIPTGIRDNCPVAMCFRVSNAVAESMALGATPDGVDVPSAVAIPADREGGAVIRGEKSREEVRFYYMEEAVIEKVINNRIKHLNKGNVSLTA